MRERDILLYMVLLHTHEIVLQPGVTLDDVTFADSGGELRLPPITQRDAAGVVASRWPAEDERGRYEYWYWKYNGTTPYEMLDDVPVQDRARMEELRLRLLDDPRVARVVEEQ